jgi:uncharacterized protein
MPPVTPADVLAQRHRAILSGDADGFADLFAPDGVIEMPFAGPGMPASIEGREAIRAYSRQMVASLLHIEDFEMVEFYQTQDPEVVVVEMRATATLTTTGQSFTAPSIQVFRIREGQIALFRDFANRAILEDVIGKPALEG